MFSNKVLLVASIICCVAASRPRSSYRPPRPSPSYNRPAPPRPRPSPSYSRPAPAPARPSYSPPPAPQYQAPSQSSQQGYAPSGPQGPAKYDFEYAVKDDYSGNDFGHQESRDGYDTQGSYYVQLPDGRLQTVNYYVNGDSGYVAEVSYDGEAQFPAQHQGGGGYQPPQQSYQQPQQQAYQPPSPSYG